jgi:hypothetical protein
VSDRPQARDPDGRLVVFDADAELHLGIARPAMLAHVVAILATIARPDHRADDPRAGRERFYRRDLDPQRWLRVVVDFNEVPARIVTAFVQDTPPRGWS